MSQPQSTGTLSRIVFNFDCDFATFVYVERLTDQPSFVYPTFDNRRFREFVELNSQIKQNMKGHHLRDVLPQMPDKPSKQFTDHRDPAFIQDRCFKLERFIVAMTSIPHVANMVCMKAFLGIMDQVTYCVDTIFNGGAVQSGRFSLILKMYMII